MACWFHVYLSRALTHYDDLCQTVWAGTGIASYPASDEGQSWAVSDWHCSMPGPLTALCLFSWEGSVKIEYMSERGITALAYNLNPLEAEAGES